MEPWGYMPWYGMIFGPIMMIAVLAAVIVVVVLIVRWLGGGFSSRAPSSRTMEDGSRSTALDILEWRFAKGEIDKAEFEEKKKLLSR